MKCIQVWKDYKNQAAIGLNPRNHDYACAYTLKPDGKFTSPASFIILTNYTKPARAYEEVLSPFVQDELNIKFNRLKNTSPFIYNTYHPFLLDINEKMIREISGDLQNTGVEYFVIDDGWMDYYGDWNVNKEKFSNGLQPVFEDLREKGFKPGLWISLATVDARSRSFKDFKQYAVKNPQGDPTNLHGWVNDFDVYTMDILSPYYTNNSLV